MKSRFIKYIPLVAFSFGALIAPAALAQGAAAPTVPAADYGDHSSQTLTTKAWEAYGARDFPLAVDYASKCIELYSGQAKEMQAGLEGPAPAEIASSLWALNDVGTCLYIRGQVYEAQGKSALALADYKRLANEFRFAQTWDTKGWYWSPADAAKQRITVVEFDAL
ncbi:MAG: tetratricopeptide repeat protein [Puniceicoccales bacterium]